VSRPSVASVAGANRNFRTRRLNRRVTSRPNSGAPADTRRPRPRHCPFPAAQSPTRSRRISVGPSSTCRSSASPAGLKDFLAPNGALDILGDPNRHPGRRRYGHHPQRSPRSSRRARVSTGASIVAFQPHTLHAQRRLLMDAFGPASPRPTTSCSPTFMRRARIRFPA